MSIGHPSLAREYHPCVADKKKVLIPPYPFLPEELYKTNMRKSLFPMFPRHCSWTHGCVIFGNDVLIPTYPYNSHWFPVLCNGTKDVRSNIF